MDGWVCGVEFIFAGDTYSYVNMRIPSIGDNKELIRLFLLRGPKVRGPVKTHIQLHGYDDLRRFNSPIETDLAAIPERIYGGFPKPSWLACKRRLFSMLIPQKWLGSISETSREVT